MTRSSRAPFKPPAPNGSARGPGACGTIFDVKPQNRPKIRIGICIMNWLVLPLPETFSKWRKYNYQKWYLCKSAEKKSRNQSHKVDLFLADYWHLEPLCGVSYDFWRERGSKTPRVTVMKTSRHFCMALNRTKENNAYSLMHLSVCLVRT